VLRRLALLLAAACLLAGCGEEAAGNGQATLWITRDRGAKVMLDTTVPAGISAMEALRRKADVETRYGGRYVQAIDGIEGSLSGQHDWFYFVNGYEADLSAVDYELHDGDVLWWDHRSWKGRMREPIVVGAFPEPFLHGWAGKRRPSAIEGASPELEDALGRLVGVTAAVLLAVCFHVPRRRRWPYLVGTLTAAAVLFVGSPLAARYGGIVYWEGPSVPVIGRLDVTSEELAEALFQSLRFAAVGLAFAVYALLLDQDRLLLAGGRLRRSVLAVALATRLLPTLERDAAGFVEALRGRGVAVEGLRGRARLLSPLVAGSLERSLNLAESMEARGFGRPGRTRAPSPPWSLPSSSSWQVRCGSSAGGAADVRVSGLRACAERRVARVRAGRARLLARPLGLGKVDAVAGARRARAALPRRALRRASRGRRPRHPPRETRRPRPRRCGRLSGPR